MKRTILIALICSVLLPISAQLNYDSTNYCDHYSMLAHTGQKKVKTTYLDNTDLAKVAFDEMTILGFERVFKFKIIKLDSVRHITAICYSETSNFGFLYEGMCGMTPSQSNRNVVSLSRGLYGYDYGEKIMGVDGINEMVRIDTIPENLHILKMENYWYQESDDPSLSKDLVSKEFIYELLRNDIRAILESIK